MPRYEDLRRREAGEVVQSGDYVLIHESYALITPCRYDLRGDRCCVGMTVEQQHRIFAPLRRR